MGATFLQFSITWQFFLWTIFRWSLCVLLQSINYTEIFKLTLIPMFAASVLVRNESFSFRDKILCYASANTLLYASSFWVFLTYSHNVISPQCIIFSLFGPPVALQSLKICKWIGGIEPGPPGRPPPSVTLKSMFHLGLHT